MQVERFEAAVSQSAVPFSPVLEIARQEVRLSSALADESPTQRASSPIPDARLRRAKGALVSLSHPNRPLSKLFVLSSCFFSIRYYMYMCVYMYLSLYIYIYIYIYIHVYIYIYIYICMCVYIYIYIYIHMYVWAWGFGCSKQRPGRQRTLRRLLGGVCRAFHCGDCLASDITLYYIILLSACAHMYMYVYIYIYIHTHMHKHTYIHMYVCIYIYIHTCIHLHTYIHRHIQLYVHIHIHIHITK